MHRRVRRLVVGAAAVASTALVGVTGATVGSDAVGAVGPVGPVGPGSVVALLLDQGTAFSYLGHSCGGIQEQNDALGFDPTTGYPTGVSDLSTRCGGSGRGGGYHTTTYTTSVLVTWDFTGAVVSTASPSTPPVVDGSLITTDAHGNQLVNANGSATLTLGPAFTPPPRLATLSVATGPVAGGTLVTLTGTGFTGASGVSFGGAAAAFTVVSDTTITATAPAAPGGTVNVTVTGPGGASATGPADRFTYTAGSGGGGGSTTCTRATGSVTSFRLTKCSPKVRGETKAMGAGLGSGTLTWSSDGTTTDVAVAVSSPGQGSCPAGATEEDVSGTVVGGTSRRTAVGETVSWALCASATGRVSLVAGTTASL